MAPSPTSQNRILSRLSKADFRLLKPHLEPVDLPLRKMLAAKNKRVEHVYFPESGFASVVANGDTAIEVGIIGREGMTGMSVALGNSDRIPYETYMQLAGHGQRISAEHLRKAIAASVPLHHVLLAYVHCFMTQTTQTVRQRARQDRRSPGALAADGA